MCIDLKALLGFYSTKISGILVCMTYTCYYQMSLKFFENQAFIENYLDTYLKCANFTGRKMKILP